MRHEFYISNYNITDYVFDGYIEKSLSSEISKAEIKVKKNILDYLNLLTGQVIYIKRKFNENENIILFKGKIEIIRNENSYLHLICFDMLHECATKVANMVYLSSDHCGGVISEIFKDLLIRFTSLSFSSSSIENSGNLERLDKFICRSAYVFDRLKALAKTINWRFWYNPQDNFVYFKPIKYELCNSEINQDNLASLIVIEEDKTELANKIVAIGTKIETIRKETFSGNGTTQTFILQKKPESVKVSINGIIKKGGKMEDKDNDYYISKDEKKVIFKSIVPTGNNNVEIEYSFFSPIPITKQNENSISLYGIYEKIITLLDVQTLADLEKRIDVFLSTFSYPFVSAKFKYINAKPYDFEVGKRVKLTDLHNTTRILLIRRIIYNLFYHYDEMELGDKEFRLETWLSFDIEKRIKRLEEETIRETDILYNSIQQQHNFSVKRKLFKKTINKLNDSFVLGISTLGGNILLPMEGDTNFVTENCTLSVDENEHIIGQKSFKITKTSGNTSCFIRKEGLNLNLSDYFQVEDDIIKKGSIDIWLKQNSIVLTGISITLIDSQNRTLEINGLPTPPDTSFNSIEGWNYFVFKAIGLSSIDLSSINKIKISFSFNTSSQVDFWIDDISIAKSHKGAFKLNERKTLYSIEEIIIN